MAGPYVHCLVSRESLKELFSNPSLAQFQIITQPDEDSDYFPYVCLGSVSPDLPYPAQKMGMNCKQDANGWTWGDKFHKQKTGSFIDTGMQELRSMPDKDSALFYKKTAWLLGYYSHVITDLVIHAVVYELVGGCYENHSREHLSCEVIQDSLLFHDVYSAPLTQELIKVKLLKTVLEKCQVVTTDDDGPTPLPEYNLDEDIETFWDSILSHNYSEFYNTEEPKIQDWFYEYMMVMIDATGVVARAAAPGIAYQKSTDIGLIEKTKYYSEITLPDGKTGEYKKDIFNKAVQEVTQRLQVFLSAIVSDEMYDSFKQSLGQWNLDKGTIDGTSPTFALWNGQTEYPFDCKGDPPSTK